MLKIIATDSRPPANNSISKQGIELPNECGNRGYEEEELLCSGSLLNNPRFLPDVHNARIIHFCTRMLEKKAGAKDWLTAEREIVLLAQCGH
jgi:hypothetical protein